MEIWSTSCCPIVYVCDIKVFLPQKCISVYLNMMSLGQQIHHTPPLSKSEYEKLYSEEMSPYIVKNQRFTLTLQLGNCGPIKELITKGPKRECKIENLLD